jgi:hypothetical protein
VLGDLLTALEKRDKETKRVDFRFSDAKFDNKEKKVLKVGSDQLFLTPNSFDELCEVTEFPKPYAKRCPSELQKHNINFWMDKRGGTMHSALVEGDTIRTFMNPSYPYVSTHKVVDAAFSEHAEEFEVAGNWQVDDAAVEFITFTPEFDKQIVDSGVRGGLRFLHSDSWSLFPRFDTYIYRVLCTNGAVSPLEHKKFRVSGKSELEILTQVRSYVKTSLEQIPTMLEGFLESQNVVVDNFVALIGRICVENKLPKKLRDLLVNTAATPEFLSTIQGQKITTLHDIVNLFSYVASHSKSISAEHREHLASIAGNIMLHNSTRCVSCGGVVD